MVEINQLRIGNLVGYKNNIYPVLSIRERTVKIDEGSVRFGALSEIEITGEWLLKLGFKSYHKVFRGNGYFERNIYEIKNSYGKIIFQILSNGEVFKLYKPLQRMDIKSVHQLQNLYYAITHNELILNKH